MLLDAGAWEQACSIYARFLRQDPYDLPALRGMMRAERIAGATEEHLEWCHRVLEIEPWNREANLMVGKHLQEEGHLKEAVVRYMLAYRCSDFAMEKKEVLGLLEEIKQLEIQEAQSAIEKSDDTK